MRGGHGGFHPPSTHSPLSLLPWVFQPEERKKMIASDNEITSRLVSEQNSCNLDVWSKSESASMSERARETHKITLK
jgi:hypothetical protein